MFLPSYHYANVSVSDFLSLVSYFFSHIT